VEERGLSAPEVAHRAPDSDEVRRTQPTVRAIVDVDEAIEASHRLFNLAVVEEKFGKVGSGGQCIWCVAVDRAPKGRVRLVEPPTEHEHLAQRVCDTDWLRGLERDASCLVVFTRGCEYFD